MVLAEGTWMGTFAEGFSALSRFHAPRVRRGFAEGPPRAPSIWSWPPWSLFAPLQIVLGSVLLCSRSALSIALDLLSVFYMSEAHFQVPEAPFQVLDLECTFEVLLSNALARSRFALGLLSLALDLLSLALDLLSAALIYMIMIYGIILGHVSRDSSQSSMASIAKGTFPGRSGTWKGRRMGTCRGRTFSGPKCQQFRGP